jgi:ribosome biogenesis GTPase A
MEKVAWCLENHPCLEKDEFFRLMVVGLPNTGKSSLINALRRTYLGRGITVIPLTKRRSDLPV